MGQTGRRGEGSLGDSLDLRVSVSQRRRQKCQPGPDPKGWSRRREEGKECPAALPLLTGTGLSEAPFLAQSHVWGGMVGARVLRVTQSTRYLCQGRESGVPGEGATGREEHPGLGHPGGRAGVYV